LQWAAPSEELDLTYAFYRGTSPDFSVTGVDALLLGKTDALTFSDVTATPGTVYYYRVVVIDLTGNPSEGSVAVSAQVAGADLSRLLPIVGAAAAAAAGIAVVAKRRAKSSSGLALGERRPEGLAPARISPGPAGSDAWNTSASAEAPSPATPSSGWDDDDDGWESIGSAPTPAASTSAAAQPVGGTGRVDVNTRAMWDTEMRDLYHSAQEFESMENYAQAVKSYEMLIRLAQRNGDAASVDAFKKRIEELYDLD
jgi:hypothetical protein